MPLVGDLYSPAFPSTCRVRDGQASNSCRIYGNRQLVVFLSDHSIDPEYSNHTARAVIEFAQAHKCKFIFTAEGVADELQLPKDASQENILELLTQAAKRASLKDEEEDEDEDDEDAEPRKGKGKGKGKGKQPSKKPAAAASVSSSREAPPKKDRKNRNKEPEDDVLFVTNNSDLGRELHAMGLKYLRNALIGGVSGRLQAEAAVACSDITVTCLVARYNPLLSEANTPMVMVRTLKRILKDVDINTDKLEKKTKRLQRKISKAILEATSSKMKAHPSMYM